MLVRIPGNIHHIKHHLMILFNNNNNIIIIIIKFIIFFLIFFIYFLKSFIIKFFFNFFLNFLNFINLLYKISVFFIKFLSKFGQLMKSSPKDFIKIIASNFILKSIYLFFKNILIFYLNFKYIKQEFDHFFIMFL